MVKLTPFRSPGVYVHNRNACHHQQLHSCVDSYLFLVSCFFGCKAAQVGGNSIELQPYPRYPVLPLRSWCLGYVFNKFFGVHVPNLRRCERMSRDMSPVMRLVVVYKKQPGAPVKSKNCMILLAS